MNIPQIKHIITFILLIGAVSLTILLYLNIGELEVQINLRDQLIRDKNKFDSLSQSLSKRNSEIIEKYIYDCNISIDGKKVSTDELIEFISGNMERIKSLEKELNSVRDTLDKFKAFHELTNKYYNISFTVDKNIVSIIEPKDTLSIYRSLYKLAQKDYGIDYVIKEEANKTTFSKILSRADTGLALYKYFFKSIRTDSSLKGFRLDLKALK